MRDGFMKRAGPSRRRPQKAGRETVEGIRRGEELHADALAHRAGKHGIDDCVEDDVVDDGTPGEEAGMPQDHMVEFMQNQQEEIPI